MASTSASSSGRVSTSGSANSAANAFESLHIHHHDGPLTSGDADRGPCRPLGCRVRVGGSGHGPPLRAQPDDVLG
jgi:hypothetical protein